MRSRASAILLAAALLLVPATDVVAGDDDALLQQQKELRGLKEQIEQNRKKIEELRKKEKDLGDLDGRIRRDRDLTTRYLSELEEQERRLLDDLTQRQTQLDERTTQADRAAELLRKRLRLYQRSRRPHAAELLFSSRSFGELFARGAFLARAIQKDRADLIWLERQRSEVAVATALLESRRTGLQALQEEKLREKATLDQKSARARDQIAQLRKERGQFESRQKELAKTEAQIRNLIRRLEEEREKARKRGLPPVTGPGLENRRGRMAWPAQGDVVTRFGVELHPRFGTKVPSNGIDISAPAGAAIAAVAPGLAEFVDWLPGYGRTVIINHGGGYYTLYAHCSRVLVPKGAQVAEGQRIADVGDTDSVKGTCLHFEIRRGQEAMNPQEWLR